MWVMLNDTVGMSWPVIFFHMSSKKTRYFSLISMIKEVGVDRYPIPLDHLEATH